MFHMNNTIVRLNYAKVSLLATCQYFVDLYHIKHLNYSKKNNIQNYYKLFILIYFQNFLDDLLIFVMNNTIVHLNYPNGVESIHRYLKLQINQQVYLPKK